MQDADIIKVQVQACLIIKNIKPFLSFKILDDSTRGIKKATNKVLFGHKTSEEKLIPAQTTTSIWHTVSGSFVDLITKAESLVLVFLIVTAIELTSENHITKRAVLYLHITASIRVTAIE